MFRLTGLFKAVRLSRTVCSAADDMAKSYYAVRRGTKPGVYYSW